MLRKRKRSNRIFSLISKMHKLRLMFINEKNIYIMLILKCLDIIIWALFYAAYWHYEVNKSIYKN